ncbi:MAG: cupredoxin domain-containing protein [Alicyclobacillus sp.]|nr:cupredoxin domain-containing protein [Alicyclobacillus sp.]
MDGNHARGGRAICAVAVAVAATAGWAFGTPLALAQGRHVDIQITDTGFQPNQVTATVDQSIRITVANRGTTTHQFSIPYYRIYSENLAPGQTQQIEFSPWQTGSFEMVSDPSGKDRPEFRGTFHVQPGA